MRIQQQAALQHDNGAAVQLHAVASHVARHLAAARRTLPRAQRPAVDPQALLPVGREHRVRGARHGILVDARPRAERA